MRWHICRPASRFKKTFKTRASRIWHCTETMNTLYAEKQRYFKHGQRKTLYMESNLHDELSCRDDILYYSRWGTKAHRWGERDLKIRYYSRRITWNILQIALNNSKRCVSLVYKIRSEVCWCVANCGINFGEFALDLSSVVTTKQWLGLKGQSFSLSQWFSKFVTGLF